MTARSKIDDPESAINATVIWRAETVETALQSLASRDPTLAKQLAAVFIVVVREAASSGRFSQSLAEALATAQVTSTPRRSSNSRKRSEPTGARPKNRRLAGVVDPFIIYSESGEQELRSRLTDLHLELLRDIVAEHGMDNDRLAMKWKDPARVIERIVDRVVARSAKGSAFRGDRP